MYILLWNLNYTNKYILKKRAIRNSGKRSLLYNNKRDPPQQFCISLLLDFLLL